MKTCKVIFEAEDGQKIILDFQTTEGGLEYKPSVEPAITDPKQDLGLAGALCTFFINKLSESNEGTEVDDAVVIDENKIEPLDTKVS